LTCTPTHQTAACNFNQIQDSINTSTTNLVNSFNNVTTTPLTPVNNSAALGFGVVFNVFITIPNAFRRPMLHMAHPDSFCLYLR
jgi:hypothetical protein